MNMDAVEEFLIEHLAGPNSDARTKAKARKVLHSAFGASKGNAIAVSTDPEEIEMFHKLRAITGGALASMARAKGDMETVDRIEAEIGPRGLNRLDYEERQAAKAPQIKDPDQQSLHKRSGFRKVWRFLQITAGIGAACAVVLFAIVIAHDETAKREYKMFEETRLDHGTTQLADDVNVSLVTKGDRLLLTFTGRPTSLVSWLHRFQSREMDGSGSVTWRNTLVLKFYDRDGFEITEARLGTYTPKHSNQVYTAIEIDGVFYGGRETLNRTHSWHLLSKWFAPGVE